MQDLTTTGGTPLSVQDMAHQVSEIQRLMKTVMREDVHFGVIPGTNKRALLKPGAEKIGLMFRCTTDFRIRREDLPNGHREYEVVCQITDRDGSPIGQGVGSCTTMEKKYRYRAENTGKPVPREYWDTKNVEEIGGHGFVPRKVKGSWFIFAQTEYDNPADYYNTVLKMAKKRAYVDAILTCTAASDFFDQEEIVDTPELFTPDSHQHEPARPAEKPAYPMDRLNENLDAWRDLIEGGQKTPEQIIANVSKVATLSGEQKALIMNLQPPQDEDIPT